MDLATWQHRAAFASAVLAYNPRQPRDARGRWAKAAGGVPAVDPRAVLARGVKSGVADRRPLGNGDMATVEAVTFNDGSKAVRKRTRRVPTGRSPKDQNDAEELAAKVAHAIGVKAPAVLRVSDSEILMEYEQDDMPAGAWMRGGEMEQLATTPQGQRMGLLDLLISNPDRHPGNYLVSDDQSAITAIDHGFAWQELEDFYPSVFTRGYGRTAPLSPADVEVLRPRLQALRGDFEQLGHVDWHDQVMEMFEHIAPRAVGTERLFSITAAFNPNQRRGPDGRWISMGGGGLPEGDSPAPSGVSEEDDELYRELRSEYGWDLHQAADDVWQASRERETDPDPRWLEADPQWEAGDGDAVLRKLMRNLEWDLEDQPELADAAMERLREHIEAEYPEAVADLPEPPERGALPQLHPRANASDGYRGAQAARADALTEGLRSGVAAQKSLSAGFMGDTRLLTLNDGSQTVYKRAISTLRPEDLNWEIKDQTDAEHLSSLLAGAVGAPAPVVHRLNDAEVAMELVSGRPADAAGLTDARRRDILATDDAVRIGLLDVLLNNTDRHGGNWMVDDAGGPVAIDHGMAFAVDPPAGTSGATKSPFATEHFINPDGTFKATNSLTRSDVTRLEGEIERIRPQFERAGRTDWLDAALGRLRQLGEHAQAPAVTTAQRDAFTSAAQRATFALASRPLGRYTVDTRLPEEQ